MSYLASAVATWTKAGIPPPGVLLAFPHYPTDDIEQITAPLRDIGCPIFADSGAFTQWTTGRHVNLDDYCQWVDRWQHLFTVYANLDVIGSAARTADNYQTMVDRGFSPLYVVSPATPGDVIDAAPPGPAALGGLTRVGRQKVNVARWIRWASNKLGQRSHIHAFGVTDLPLITSSPNVTSTDSTTWMAGFKYGAVSIWRPRLGRLVQHRDHRIATDKGIQTDLERLGYSWRRVLTAVRSRDGDLLAEVSLASLQTAQQRVADHHGRPFTIYAAAVL